MMTWIGGVMLALLLGVLGNDLGDWFNWLAKRLIAVAARWRYHEQPERAAIRAEEFAAILEDRPGSLLKLATAVGFIASATPRMLASKLPRIRLAARIRARIRGHEITMDLRTVDLRPTELSPLGLAQAAWSVDDADPDQVGAWAELDIRLAAMRVDKQLRAAMEASLTNESPRLR